MAVRTKSTKPAVEETVEEAVDSAPTAKQIVNEGIARVLLATGIDVQKNRYKAMRAIAWQAFANAIEDGTFEELVDQAIANVDELPTGWEIERVVADEKPAPKAKVAAKAPTKKAAAKPAAKVTARKRPTR